MAQHLLVACEIRSVGRVQQRLRATAGGALQSFHAWPLQPLIWGFLRYCWCYLGFWLQENL